MTEMKIEKNVSYALYVMATTFHWWLDYNEKRLRESGLLVVDDNSVMLPEYPSRRVIKAWVEVLERANRQLQAADELAQTLSKEAKHYRNDTQVSIHEGVCNNQIANELEKIVAYLNKEVVGTVASDG